MATPGSQAKGDEITDHARVEIVTRKTLRR
jgi:hypothetical protein